MGKYRELDNPVVEKKIDDIVRLMTNEIITRFHPKAIILSGSFGKGEITVIESNGCLQFLSDCEVIIVPNKYIFNQNKIKQFSEDFYKKTGLKVGISGILLSVYLGFPFLYRMLKPTMANYDLKWGSKVIYGKNYLDKLPDFRPEEIPIWEGIKLLLNRMAESLEHFSLENPNKEMVFWTDKIMLACQDALLLSLGKFHYLYRKKNEMFQKLFSMYFSDLEDELPNFLDSTIEATERKLNGTNNVDDPKRYWFDTAEICNKIFRYVIKKDIGIEFDDYLELLDKILKNRKIRGYTCDFVIFLNFLVNRRLFSLKIVRKRHMIYSLIPLAYFGLSNENYLKKCSEILSTFGVHTPTEKNSTEQLLNQIVGLWKKYEGLI